MAETQEAVCKICMVHCIGPTQYFVKWKNKVVEVVPNGKTVLGLGWLVRVQFRTGEPGIVTGIVKKK